MHVVASAGTLRGALLEEQASICALLDDVVAAVRGERFDEATWTRFTRALLAQLDAEDQLVSAMPYDRGGRVIVHEHRYLRACLRQLDEDVSRGAVRTEALESFRDILRAHARSDDRLLYLWAEDELDVGDRAAIREALARRIQALAGHSKGTSAVV